MKDIRASLKRSLLGGVLAAFASGPLSAATFALTDEIELENVSAAASMDRKNVFQINYAAKQPQFLGPMVGIGDPEDEATPDALVKIWFGAGTFLELSLSKGNAGFSDPDTPRVRWNKAPEAQKVRYRADLDLADPEVFPSEVSLEWPATESDDNEPIMLDAFVVQESDTTCGFPNDFFDFSLTSAARSGQIWAQTATFAPHPFDGPRVPNLSGNTWLVMPMPHVVGYGIGTGNHAASPDGPYLSYPNHPQTAESMVSGFHQQSSIFRCRVYASGERPDFDLPNGVSPFGANRFGEFYEPLFPLTPASVPLPSGSVLLLTGLLGVAACGRRKRKTT